MRMKCASLALSLLRYKIKPPCGRQLKIVSWEANKIRGVRIAQRCSKPQDWFDSSVSARVGSLMDRTSVVVGSPSKPII